MRDPPALRTRRSPAPRYRRPCRRTRRRPVPVGPTGERPIAPHEAFRCRGGVRSRRSHERLVIEASQPANRCENALPVGVDELQSSPAVRTRECNDREFQHGVAALVARATAAIGVLQVWDEDLRCHDVPRGTQRRTDVPVCDGRVVELCHDGPFRGRAGQHDGLSAARDRPELVGPLGSGCPPTTRWPRRWTAPTRARSPRPSPRPPRARGPTPPSRGGERTAGSGGAT